MPLDVVETLADLVRIPSVNPMGRNVTGEIYYEHRVTDYLESLFRQLSLPFERHAVAPLRENIIVRVEGSTPPEKGGPVLMFEAHQDTVPVDGMEIDPFAADIEDGRLFGRGACDIKGGMAAMLAALVRVADERPASRPTIILACTVNEEHGFTGATHWADTYMGRKGLKSKLLARSPDATIVAEPTELNVVVAHKGACRWRCHTGGLAAHSSQPERGDNAFYHMARVLTVLEQYARDVVPHLKQHPLVGHPTLSVGLISGGISVNTVPDRCTIEIDRRVLPGEDPDAAFTHAVTHLNSFVTTGTPIIHDKPFMLTKGLNNDHNVPLAERLGQAIQHHAPNAGEQIGVPFGTDAPHYAATGSPTVVFGPGSIAQAHTKDEWIDLNQLKTASEILYDLVRHWDE
ncbi:Acetylornithine deacetylase [Anatilimnocola aggregata]|uniref:Probable succinyl-diaminopimelate desuccinylase n=1 Tax=Anatilimnocola aggregata TaxID=2528021 RepID=A0A517YAQ9_9BACT|nr:M20 family metallopeptidase [Anatilimnocola aggregata]QDU27281.1 Acetylornithine deacetylase [Anatilimnocola aggregata]